MREDEDEDLDGIVAAGSADPGNLVLSAGLLELGASHVAMIQLKRGVSPRQPASRMCVLEARRRCVGGGSAFARVMSKPNECKPLSRHRQSRVVLEPMRPARCKNIAPCNQTVRWNPGAPRAGAGGAVAPRGGGNVSHSQRLGSSARAKSRQAGSGAPASAGAPARASRHDASMVQAAAVAAARG